MSTRAEDWRRVRCEGQEGEQNRGARPLLYADVLADLGN